MEAMQVGIMDHTTIIQPPAPTTIGLIIVGHLMAAGLDTTIIHPAIITPTTEDIALHIEAIRPTIAVATPRIVGALQAAQDVNSEAEFYDGLASNPSH